MMVSWIVYRRTGTTSEHKLAVFQLYLLDRVNFSSLHQLSHFRCWKNDNEVDFQFEKKNVSGYLLHADDEAGTVNADSIGSAEPAAAEPAAAEPASA